MPGTASPINISDNATLFEVVVTGPGGAVLKADLTHASSLQPPAVQYFIPGANGTGSLNCNDGLLGNTPDQPSTRQVSIVQTELEVDIRRFNNVECMDYNTSSQFFPDAIIKCEQRTGPTSYQQVGPLLTSTVNGATVINLTPYKIYRITVGQPNWATQPLPSKQCGITGSTDNTPDQEGTDLWKISRHILGITGEEFTEAYQMFAADVLNTSPLNPGITTFDIVKIRNLKKVISSTTHPDAIVFPTWDFIPENIYDDVQGAIQEGTANPLIMNQYFYQHSYSTEIYVVPGKNTVRFYPIKNGDVDQTCSDCSGSGFSPQSDDRTLGEGENNFILVPEMRGKKGDILNLPILSGNNTTCFFMGLDLNLDADYLEIVEATPADRFGSTDHAGSNVRYTYLDVDDLTKPGPVREEQVLFTLKVRLLRDITSISDHIEIDPTNFTPIWHDGPYGKATIQLKSASNWATDNTASVWPNPAHSSITVTGDLPETAQITVYASDGRLVHTQNLANGRRIDVATLVPGIYAYTIAQGSDLITGKFIKK